MKTITLITALLLAGPVAADGCATLGETSATIMDTRQSGAPMSSLMQAANDLPDADLGQLMRDVIVAAYEVPRYSSAGMKKQAVQEFQNRIERECYQMSGPAS